MPRSRKYSMLWSRPARWSAINDQRSAGTVTKPRIQIDQALIELQAEFNWLGTISSNWHEPANWSSSLLPSCTDEVLITAGAPHQPVLSANATARHLVLEDGASLTATSGTLTLCGNLQAQGAGVANFIGGTLHLTGSSSASINLPGPGNQLHHLLIGDGIDAKQVDLLSALHIAGDLDIADDAFIETNGHSVHFNGGNQLVSISGAPLQGVFQTDFENLSGWVQEDANDDGVIWFVSTSTAAPNSPNSGQHVRYSWNTNGTTAANDWLFSPAISLLAGRSYTMTFNYGARSSDYPESLGVHLGSSNNSAAMSVLLFNNPNITHTSWQQATATFTAPESGDFRLGFHANSAADRWELAVDDILVTTQGSVRFSDIHVSTGTALALSASVPVVIEGDLFNEGLLDISDVNLSVNGIVSNAGTLIDTREVPDASTTHIGGILNEDGTTWAYRGVDITPDATSLGLTTVMIAGQQDCNPPDGGPLFHRCFDIAPDTQQPATIRFWLSEAERNGQNAADVIAFRHDGDAWTGASSSATYAQSGSSIACNSVDGNQCWVEAANVSAFSAFVIGDPGFAGGSPATYTIGGMLSGLAPGNSVVLQNNGSDDLILSANGGFNFATALDDGQAYSVTVLGVAGPEQQRCTVVNGSGTLEGENVVHVAVSCIVLEDGLFHDRFEH